MPTAAEPTSLRPVLPFRLGRFTLCRELGAGGMATVYLSRMRLAAGLERTVALKTIHAHLAKERTFVDMFLDEAKIASLISHPNVCSVFDFGEVGGTYFLAMEYLVGEPLFDVINTIAERENDDLLDAVPFLAARIIADACEGLHAAHSLTGIEGKPLEVVHRDVSPQNLVVTYDGSVKVVDFGCAKALERVTQTNTGMMKGKVSYAAPEQLRAEPLDARVDVFALGVCLWEMLTLRQLFRRDTAIQTAMAVLQEPIPRATENAPWVPEELADIAERALARDRDERYRTARDLGRALRGFIARSGVPFESAEVAEWMGHLFEARHDAKRAMVAEVDAIELSAIAPVAKVDEAARAEPSASKPAIGTEPTRLAKTPSKEQPAIDPDADEPVVLPTRTGRYVAAALALLALVGAGVFAYVKYREPILAAFGGRPSNEATASEPTASETTAPSEAPDETAPSEAAELEAARDAHEHAHEDALAAATSAPGTPPTETVAQALDARPEPPTRGATRASDARASRDAREGERSPTPTPSPEPTRATTTLDFSRGPVTIRTETGWATVFHDGHELGRTPLNVTLPVGLQHVRVLPYGQEPARQMEVRVEWGARATLIIPMEPRGTEDWGNPY